MEGATGATVSPSCARHRAPTEPDPDDALTAMAIQLGFPSTNARACHPPQPPHSGGLGVGKLSSCGFTGTLRKYLSLDLWGLGDTLLGS